MGLVSGDVAFSAYQGTDEFSGHPVESLRAIRGCLFKPVHLDGAGIRAYLLRS